MPLIGASTYLHENHISTMNEYNEDQKKSLALYPEGSKDHTLLSAYFRNPEDFSLTDAGQAIAAQKFGPHASHTYIPERANGDNTYPRYYCHCKRTISRRSKKNPRCLIYQGICAKERNASPPISKRSSSKSQNMTRFFSPKKPRIRPLGPGEKIYQGVVTNLPIGQILSIDNTRQKELLFAYFTNPGAFVFIREAFSILKNILVRSYGMPNFPKSFRFEKLIKIDGFVYDEVQEQIYLHVQARGQYDIAFQDYRIPVSQIEGVLHRLIELTTIKT